MHLRQLFPTLLLVTSVAAQDAKTEQLERFTVNDLNELETTSAGVPANSTFSLRIGPRGYVLLEDTVARKKFIHFTHERQPERVVHATGHGAYGQFSSYGDWSNITAACWLQENATSDIFSRFSVHNPGQGGSEVGRDTHGFATKIYSKCGNQDLVFNHLPSFFINDGIMFPDMVHSIKADPDKGFPTGGSAHTTAYDFFNQRPEGAWQRMAIQSDMGLPIDSRHMRGNGVHTFRFINSEGKSSLFKWYWEPTLGVRSRIDDEAQKIVGMNADYFRVDMYKAIEAGLYPEWELLVQLFPDDGTYMYEGIDLLDPTLVVPFELNEPLKFGKMVLNRNPTNFFAETESVQFAPANTVTGISMSVPDAVLQWRLMVYDETASHRHGSPNYNQLPINCPLSGVHNNERDGYMAINIPRSNLMHSPNSIGGIHGVPDEELTLGWTDIAPGGPVGRYGFANDAFTQVRAYWYNLDTYAQQHAVNAYRYDLNNVENKTVAETYISTILNPIDNCLARRVAYGIGTPLPELGSGSARPPNATYPSLFPSGVKTPLPVVGLSIALLATDDSLNLADFEALTAEFKTQKLNFAVIAPRAGKLDSGVSANLTYLTGGNSVFYDAVVIGSAANGTADPYRVYELDFLREAYGHGKPLVAIGNGVDVLTELGYSNDAALGVFAVGSAADAASALVNSLGSPGRYPSRVPVDDVKSICGE